MTDTFTELNGEALLRVAREAAKSAYAPYSRFRVGAAVASGRRIFSGCNVENASYGLSICAERNAVFQAIAEGCTRIDAVAVACIDAPINGPINGLMPCGACRQVLAEFATPLTVVWVDRAGRKTVGELLPIAFGLKGTEH